MAPSYRKITKPNQTKPTNEKKKNQKNQTKQNKKTRNKTKNHCNPCYTEIMWNFFLFKLLVLGSTKEIKLS